MGQRHAPAALYPRERPGNHCTGGWVGPRVGLDSCGNLATTGIRSPDRPARSQSLYRLRYPTHPHKLLFLFQVGRHASGCIQYWQFSASYSFTCCITTYSRDDMYIILTFVENELLINSVYLTCQKFFGRERHRYKGNRQILTTCNQQIHHVFNIHLYVKETYIFRGLNVSSYRKHIFTQQFTF